MIAERLRFRVIGNLHIGLRKWGYVRSARSYLPGWTLWGALTNFFKRESRIEGINTFTGVGDYLNENFWFGHLVFTRLSKPGNTFVAYLPWLKSNGKIEFRWLTFSQDALKVADMSSVIRHPLSYRHGVVRGKGLGSESLGRLYLTETFSISPLEPMFLEGWVMRTSEPLPLEKGDCLRIGGGRTSGGALLVYQPYENIPHVASVIKPLVHMRFSDDIGGLRGSLERIVLRRTVEGCPRGFGGVIVDWGLHLAPGWESEGTNVSLKPVKSDDGWRHGTVEVNNMQ